MCYHQTGSLVSVLTLKFKSSYLHLTLSLDLVDHSPLLLQTPESKHVPAAELLAALPPRMVALSLAITPIHAANIVCLLINL